MAHNFKYIGDYYVSEFGSDSNPGTSPDAPKRSLGSAQTAAANNGNKLIIAGTGTYEESLTIYSQIKCDGVVVLKGNGSNSLTIIGSLTDGICDGSDLLTIQDYSVLNLQFGGAGLTVSGMLIKSIGTINAGISGNANGYIKFVKCKIVNPGLFNINTANTTFNKCNGINVNNIVGAINQISNSYFNGASVLRMAAVANSIVNSDIMAFIYAAGDSTMYNLASYTAAYPTRVANSFNLPPLFNNISKLDFTLQANSPLIGKATDFSNIGGTSYAVSYALAINESVTNNNSANNVWSVANGAVLYGLILNGQDLVVATGFTQGYARSAPMFVAANPEALNAIGYVGFMQFNKSKAGGSATNANVPDYKVWLSTDNATGGSNPDRLVFRLRTSTKATAPTSDADWDNNGYAPAGQWLVIAWFETPMVDTSFRGSGEPDFNSAAAQPVVGCWAQMEVYLTNGYTN